MQMENIENSNQNTKYTWEQINRSIRRNSAVCDGNVCEDVCQRDPIASNQCFFSANCCLWIIVYGSQFIDGNRDYFAYAR